MSNIQASSLGCQSTTCGDIQPLKTEFDQHRPRRDFAQSGCDRMINFIGSIVWRANATGRILDKNQRWAEFLPDPEPQSANFGIFSQIHPADRERAIAQIQQALQEQKSYHTALRLRWSDQTYHWVVMEANPIQDETGQVIEWIGTYTDANPIQQYLPELRGEFTEGNHRGMECGTSTENPAQETNSGDRTPENQPVKEPRIVSGLKSSEQSLLEDVLKTSHFHIQNLKNFLALSDNKTAKHLEHFFKFLPQSSEHFTQQIPPDKTEPKVSQTQNGNLPGADQAWSDRQEHYQLLTKHSTELISRQTATGIYLDMSSVSRKLLGYEPDEMIGHSIYDFVHPDDITTIKKIFYSLLHYLNVANLLYRIRRKDGQYIWCETTLEARRCPRDGSFQDVISVSRDVSDRVLSQAEICALHRELDRLLQKPTDQIKRNS